jgi:Sec-independent protein secretion pathway component TatC
MMWAWVVGVAVMMLAAAVIWEVWSRKHPHTTEELEQRVKETEAKLKALGPKGAAAVELLIGLALGLLVLGPVLASRLLVP